MVLVSSWRHEKDQWRSKQGPCNTGLLPVETTAGEGRTLAARVAAALTGALAAAAHAVADQGARLLDFRGIDVVLTQRAPHGAIPDCHGHRRLGTRQLGQGTVFLEAEPAFGEVEPLCVGLEVEPTVEGLLELLRDELVE